MSVEQAEDVQAPPSLGDQLQAMEETIHALWDHAVERDRAFQDRKARAEDIQRSISDVRARVDSLTASLKRTVRPVPKPAPAPPPRRVETAPVLQVQTPPRRPWHLAAYAAIALVAFILDIHGTPPAPQKPLRAPPAVPARRPAPPVVERDDDSDAALRLVYAFRLPGRKETVLDVLGGADEGIAGKSPWQVERLDRDTYLVTYKAAGEGEFHFEVDVPGQSVYIQPDTERHLLATDS